MTRSRLLSAALATVVAFACSSDKTTQPASSSDGSVRIVNAHTSAVDVFIDGTMAKSNVAAGQITSITTATGSHMLSLRPTGSSTGSDVNFSTDALRHPTFAAVRASSGALVAATLDDTGSVVPAGATKLRVLHLAANAGEIQVYRTQPDYGTPIRWQFPFLYTPAPTSLSAPYFQSTIGSWEVHVWQTPTDATGWTNAPIKLTVPLGSGGRKTIVILDQAGGGIRAEVID